MCVDAVCAVVGWGWGRPVGGIMGMGMDVCMGRCLPPPGAMGIPVDTPVGIPVGINACMELRLGLGLGLGPTPYPVFMAQGATPVIPRGGAPPAVTWDDMA